MFFFLSSLLMVADYQQHYTRQLRQNLTLLVTPLFYTVNAPVQLFNWLENSVSSHKALLDENMQLRYEQLLLKSKLQRLVSLRKENKELRKLLATTTEQHRRVLAAQLMAVDANPYRQLVVLDKGAKQGVFVGQAVLDANGVMGQIVEMGPYTSIALLVTDSKSAVPVKNFRTGERAILEGTTRGYDLSLTNLPKTSHIKEGDLLVTSGLAQRFPEGYPVGIVHAIEKNVGDAFIKVLVSPSALVHRTRLVLLVWPTEEERRLHQQLAERYYQPEVNG